MSRSARIVAVDFPHHIIQRGNRNQRIFLKKGDKEAYIGMLKESLVKYPVDIWAWCLMDTHVHFVVVPRREDALCQVFGKTHQLYTRMINFREKWRGYLWQGRFKSFPMDEKYLLSCVRYVENNPVKAKLVSLAENYPWSSAKSHVFKTQDPLLSKSYLDDEIGDWKTYLTCANFDDREIERHINKSFPLGSLDFLENLEKKLGIQLIPKR